MDFYDMELSNVDVDGLTVDMVNELFSMDDGVASLKMELDHSSVTPTTELPEKKQVDESGKLEQKRATAAAYRKRVREQVGVLREELATLRKYCTNLERNNAELLQLLHGKELL